MRITTGDVREEVKGGLAEVGDDCESGLARVVTVVVGLFGPEVVVVVVVVVVAKVDGPAACDATGVIVGKGSVSCNGRA